MKAGKMFFKLTFVEKADHIEGILIIYNIMKRNERKIFVELYGASINSARKLKAGGRSKFRLIDRKCADLL